MWAHQYNQEPNQVECSLHHKPWVSDGPESNFYGLEPNFGCCTANFHQGWPKFAASLFMQIEDDPEASDTISRLHFPEGLVATAYAPCELRTIIGSTPVHITEDTAYPFQGSVHFKVNPASPVNFQLLLHIPAWAQGATLTVNGIPAKSAPRAGSFSIVTRTWHAGDRIELTLPMQPRVSRWFNDSVAIERGPLVFSYGIGESWVKLRDRGMTADWQVFPTTSWDYALDLDRTDPAKIAVNEAPISENPFSRKQPPVSLQVKARKLPAWIAEDGAANPLPQSPVATGQPVEDLTLIPYAAAKLRITAFPQAKS
jgi:uncharacterized protein